MLALIKKTLMGKSYDPANIADWNNKVFATRHSDYQIKDNRIFRTSTKNSGLFVLEGAPVELICGIDIQSGLYYLFNNCLYTKDSKTGLYTGQGKNDFDALIRKHGQEPGLKKHLIISITEPAAINRDKIGLISSEIIKIK